MSVVSKQSQSKHESQSTTKLAVPMLVAASPND